MTQEDQALTDIVENLYTGHVAKRGIKWTVVVAALRISRTAKQCRERWTTHLRPKRPWTIEEEHKLAALQREFGNK